MLRASCHLPVNESSEQPLLFSWKFQSFLADISRRCHKTAFFSSELGSWTGRTLHWPLRREVCIRFVQLPNGRGLQRPTGQKWENNPLQFFAYYTALVPGYPVFTLRTDVYSLAAVTGWHRCLWLYGFGVTTTVFFFFAPIVVQDQEGMIIGCWTENFV